MRAASFGWWYPAGAANDPNAPWNQVEPPCAICGQFDDHCICPPCPVCEAMGDPICYDGDTPERCWECRMGDTKHEHRKSHGLTRSKSQIESKAKIEAQWAEEAAAEALYEAAEYLFDVFGVPTERVHAMDPTERACWVSAAGYCPRELYYSAQWSRW